MAESNRPGTGAGSAGSRHRSAGREQDAADEQVLLLDAIAALVHAVAAYGPGDECHYRRVSGDQPDDAAAGLLGAMEALARTVVRRPAGVGGPSPQSPGCLGVAAADVGTATGRYVIRAIRLRPGLFGSEASVLVIADRLRDYSGDVARVRARFGLTEREAEVALLLADRRSNAEIAAALGISDSTARHHTERVLLKLRAANRRDVPPIVRALALGRDTGGAEEP